jgi:hypothetical protein
LPATSAALVFTLTVYTVSSASGALGVKVAAVPLAVTVPAIAGVMVNTAAPRVAACIGSEKVALMVVVRATAVAAFAGTVALTLGGVRSPPLSGPVPPSPQDIVATAVASAAYSARGRAGIGCRM